MMASRMRALTPVFLLRPLVGALALAFPLSAAFAQEAPTSQLREVVVSASGFEQELRDAPASISVVTREQLQARQYRDLAEALTDVEGIDVRGSTGKTGGFDISIRGMPSDSTLILIDGRRQNAGADVTPNGFSQAHTSLIPPLASIERIEVIRGPMATLYGSDAMGGVINIITRKVAREWATSLNLEAGLPENSEDGAQQRISLYTNGPLIDNLLGLAVRGSTYRRDESDRITAPGAAPTGRNPAPGESRQHSVGARLTLTPNSQNDVWLDFEQNRTWYNNDDGRLGNRDADSTTLLIPGYADYMRFNRDQIALGHTSRFDTGVLESSLMRNTTETIGRTIPRSGTGVTYPGTRDPAGAPRELKSTSLVFDTKFVAPLGEAHVATIGGQWQKADLIDSFLSKDYKRRSWALFLEDEWRLTDTLAATFGGRYDHHDAFGGHFSPRAYLVWNPTNHWTVKGGVSNGFKAPDVRALIDGGNNVTGQGARLSIGNPNLKPETSQNTELSFLYDTLRGTNGSVTLFHNRIKDRISGSAGSCVTNPISSCAANTTATYAINADEGKTWGVELAGRIQLAPRWALNMNYTWTDSELIVNGRKVGKISDTAEHIANAQLRWEATAKLSTWLRAEYRGKSRRFDLENLTDADQILEYEALGDLKAYTLLHLGGAYKVTKDVTINANIFNLLDKDFRKYSPWTDSLGNTEYGSPYFRSQQSVKGSTPAGRTFWLSANINF